MHFFLCHYLPKLSNNIYSFKYYQHYDIFFHSSQNKKINLHFEYPSFHLFYYIEDIQIFCWIWLLFHRVNWKIFIFHEWRSHEWNIHIFYFTSEIKAIFNKNIWIFFLLYTTNLTMIGKFHFSQANSHFQLSPLAANIRACQSETK